MAEVFFSITLKGLAEDDAVLCTETTTFAVQQENSSNTFMLITPNDIYQVEDSVSRIIQLTPCLARLHRIDELLTPTAYSGHRNEQDYMDKTMYTYHDLLSVVQASELELKNGLKRKGAFEYQGYCRLFNRRYLLQLLDALITNTTMHGLDLYNLTVRQAMECIKEETAAVDAEDYVPDEILLATLSFLSSDGCELNSEDKVVELDERKICRFLGEWLLSSPRNKRWELQDFMEIWKKLGQDTFTPQLSDIDGLCVYHEVIKVQKTIQYIQYFPVHELSTDPAQRFATLFAEKPLWTSKEIMPFLIDLAPTQKERDRLLLKYTRTHRKKEITLYGSRIK